MGRQTVFGFQLEQTVDTLTAHGGLALVAECTHGLGASASWRIRICLARAATAGMRPPCLGIG